MGWPTVQAGWGEETGVHMGVSWAELWSLKFIRGRPDPSASG